MKNVMKKAWEISRNAVNKFGGTVKMYFGQALKMAWGMSKLIKKYNIDVVITSIGGTEELKLDKKPEVQEISFVKANRASMINFIKEISASSIIWTENDKKVSEFIKALCPRCGTVCYGDCKY